MSQDYQWKCQPEAENLLLRILSECCGKNEKIASLEKDLLNLTSTRLLDWIDHFVISISPQVEKELEDTGFIAEFSAPSYRVYHHPGAQLPRIIVKDEGPSVGGLAVKVDSIADFLMVRGLTCWIEGAPYSALRRSSVLTQNGVTLWAIERRGTRSMEPTYPNGNYLDKFIQATEKWQTRPRLSENEEDQMHQAIAVAEELSSLLGRDMAAWIVLECERKYWQARNTAGQLQKNRQDQLGMGWANHDHHTFRSSRRLFAQLVRLFEILGFHCRERYYTGKEAGWGAQIMENSNCGLVLFLDVDLSPDEIDIDFAHHAMPDLDKLGTIGLWCALHGDSILRAGMHHLESQFMFDELSKDLAKVGVGMMAPFSSFPYLRQAFTTGEVWQVDPLRIARLEKHGLITREQSDKFLSKGAVGSHLENLQRREGYKGFNQKNVSVIIKKTDPRQYDASVRDGVAADG